MILPWDFNVENAPRDGLTKVVIAVRRSGKVRWCVWNKVDKKWSGLLPGETPLAFITMTHPKPVAMLPPGVIPRASLPPGMNVELIAHNIRAMRGDFD